CLKSIELRRRFFPPCPCFSNRPLILIQHRQLDRETKTPFVITLIKLIPRLEVHVRILLREFEPQGRFAGSIISEFRQNIWSAGPQLPKSLQHETVVPSAAPNPAE